MGKGSAGGASASGRAKARTAKATKAAGAVAAAAVEAKSLDFEGNRHTADAFLDSKMGATHAHLNDKQRSMVQMYSQDAYRPINNGLIDRGNGKKMGKDERIAAARIQKAIRATNPLPESIIVYRGLSKTFQDHGLNPAKLAGKTLYSEAFMSTSLNYRISRGFSGNDHNGILFRINVPKGTRGIGITGQRESELVLSKRAGLDVRSVHQDKETGLWHAEADYVPPRRRTGARS